MAGGSTAEVAVGDSERSANIYINHLPATFTEDMLKELLSRFGMLERVKLGTRYALAEFNTVEEADLAILHLHGHLLAGTDDPLMVEYNTYSRKQRRTDASYPQHALSHTNLYFNNLPPSMTSKEFYALLAQYGVVVRHKLGQHGEGWGLAEFEDAGAATAAVNSINGAPIAGSDKLVSVERHIERPKGGFAPGGKGSKGVPCGFASWFGGKKGMYGGKGVKGDRGAAGCRNLYLNNLPGNFTEDDLSKLVARFGVVQRLKVGDTDVQRSWGLAEMATASQARRYVRDCRFSHHPTASSYLSSHTAQCDGLS